MINNPFDIGYYHSSQLRDMGFKAIGDNVKISKNCTIIGLENISIADNVRVDGYVTMTAVGGYIELGSYVHIASYCGIFGGGGFVAEDFAGLSSGVCVYTTSDDYSGYCLTNPTIPPEYLSLKKGEVALRKHVIVGAGTIILPSVNLGEGSAVGALSLISRDLSEWTIYAGRPAKRLKFRSKELLQCEARLNDRSA